jgi:hypothetical protein
MDSHDRLIAREIADIDANDGEGEITGYMDAVCPWCGYPDPNTVELDAGQNVCECERCGRHYYCEAMISWDYTTRRAK